MKVTVLVPTYRRVKDLERCFQALKRQDSPAYEVLLVVRDSDRETHDFLKGFDREALPLKIVDVSEPGQVAALNAGLVSMNGDIVAITDDDAVPHFDWLARIQEHFKADASIGGVGGRDWVYENGSSKALSTNSFVTVGKLQWLGKTIGNHHLGKGDAREVDILKGANMSYRREAIAGLYFNTHLKGKGAQVNNDLGFSLSVKQAGWKIIYDPSIAVNHYPSPRFDEDQRDSFNAEAYYNAAYNQTLILLDHQSKPQAVAYLLWSILIGTRGCFGLAQVMRFFRSHGMLACDRWMAASSGHIHAVRDYFLLKQQYISTSPTQASNNANLINSAKS
jgi:cellulose synthase/poly-beta-1,6-N-acetylglucosamine synthase-like glycosyltransferase